MSPDTLEAIKQSCVGNSLAEVQEEAKRTGWSIRVMVEDGKRCMGTCDINPCRINVAVVDGVVTEVFGVG